MSNTTDTSKVMVELKEIIGSIIFASHRAVAVNEIRKCMLDVAEKHGKEAKVFEELKPADIKKAIGDLQRDIAKAKSGFVLREVPGGFRFQTDPRSGPWLKVFLNKAKPNRLSRPGLETLAIIAYRQPITKAEIERIRGVSIDHVMKALMEALLVRIVGRSELPGRPFLYGTTQMFLEHFGLKDLDSLKDREMLAEMHAERGAEKLSTGHDTQTDRDQLGLSFEESSPNGAANGVTQVNEEAFVDTSETTAADAEPAKMSSPPVLRPDTFGDGPATAIVVDAVQDDDEDEDEFDENDEDEDDENDDES